MGKLNLYGMLPEIKRHEGERLKPYLCPAGKLTIGRGRNLEDRGITEQEAEYLCLNDLESCAVDLRGEFPWFDKLPIPAQEVLVNMCFNMGLKRLLGFKNALAAMKAGEWFVAAAEMLDSRWAAQVGPRAEELAEKIRALATERNSAFNELAMIRAKLEQLEGRL